MTTLTTEDTQYRKEIIDKDEVLKMAIQAELNLYVHDLTEKQYTEVIKAFAKLVADKAAAREREACLDVVKTHRIPVGNSSAGEMACEWTYEALKEIVEKIQARGEAT